MQFLRSLVLPDGTILSTVPTAPSGSGTHALISQVGDGSDGNLTINSGEMFTLDRERNFNSVVVKSGGIFNLAPYRILCKNDFIVESGGLVQFIAESASGFTNGKRLALTGSIAGNSSGGTGNNGNSSAIPYSLGGAGGNGGAGAGGNGGIAGAATPPPLSAGSWRTLFSLASGFVTTPSGIILLSPGSAGASGANEGTGSGGAGGASGALMLVNAKRIIIAGRIWLPGGNGGAKGKDNAGGGGAGAGGVAVFNSASYDGAGAVFDLPGGNGGAATGTGSPGGNGAPGVLIQTVWS